MPVIDHKQSLVLLRNVGRRRHNPQSTKASDMVSQHTTVHVAWIGTRTALNKSGRGKGGTKKGGWCIRSEIIHRKERIQIV